jgi:acetamidase/formamidase
MTKTHHVDWSPENLFWGYFEASTPPVIEIDSGDEVTLDCLPACTMDDLPPGHGGVLPAHLEALKAHEGRMGPGPHFMTGPVFVRGAKPGDVLQVDILETVPMQDWGFTAIMPFLGALPEEFTNYQRLYLSINRNAGTCTVPWGLTMPLEPFFGVMGVAPPKAWGRIGSPQPRAHGGNMDNKELQAGTTLYLPVFEEGALFSAGDGHGRQGDGEVSIAAVETALRGRFRLTVRKDMETAGPFAGIRHAPDLDGLPRDAGRGDAPRGAADGGPCVRARRDRPRPGLHAPEPRRRPQDHAGGGRREGRPHDDAQGLAHERLEDGPPVPAGAGEDN